MKITIEDVKPGGEEEIIIRCKKLSPVALKLISELKMGDNKLTGMKDGYITVLNPKNVYYFESIDNKVFIYTKQDVYETKMKLYEIESRYENTDFFRASKSIILNITTIRCVSPAYSGRFEALLLNGERVIISRQYVPYLKKKLGM